MSWPSRLLLMSSSSLRLASTSSRSPGFCFLSSTSTRLFSTQGSCLLSLRIPTSMSRKKMAGKSIDESDVVAINMDALIEAESSEVPSDKHEFRRFPDDRVIEASNLAKLPVITVVMTKNNTKISADDCDNKRIAYTSPREHGFLHAKKRSPIASQTAGMAMGQMLRNRNIRNVRVQIDGFNQGRIAVLQGFVQAGLNVVAISDVTPVHFDWPKRAKKRPRVN